LQNDISAVSGDCFVIAADNVTFDGNGHTLVGDDSSTGSGIVINGYNYVTIRNFNGINYFLNGIYTANSAHNTFSNLTLDWNPTSGIRLDSGSNYNTFTNISTSYNQYGFYLDNASNNTFTSTNSFSNSVYDFSCISSDTNTDGGITYGIGMQSGCDAWINMPV
jgi:hypothetical protein